MAEKEESNLEVYKRFAEALKEIAAENPEETVLIVSHGGTIRYFLIKEGLGDFDTIGGFDNCGYVTVVFENGTFTIENAEGVKPWQE